MLLAGKGDHGDHGTTVHQSARRGKLLLKLRWRCQLYRGDRRLSIRQQQSEQLARWRVVDHNSPALCVFVVSASRSHGGAVLATENWEY